VPVGLVAGLCEKVINLSVIFIDLIPYRRNWTLCNVVRNSLV